MVFSGRGLGDKVRMSVNQIQGLNILEDAEQLFVSERADLADRILERLSQGISPDIAQSWIAEVCRRIGQVETGGVALIPGEEALAHVRRQVESARAAN